MGDMGLMKERLVPLCGVRSTFWAVGDGFITTFKSDYTEDCDTERYAKLKFAGVSMCMGHGGRSSDRK